MRRGKYALLGLLLGACGGQAGGVGVGQAAGSSGVELAAGEASIGLAAGRSGVGLSVGGAGGAQASSAAGAAVSGGTGSFDAPHAARVCDNPLPRARGGGYQLCGDGSLRRPRAAACQVSLPRAKADQLMVFNECTADSDCTSSLYGFCADGACKYGCRVDDDCANGQACFCGEVIGSCITASCRSDADCPAEFPCTGYQAVGFATPDALACQSPSDACLTDAQCSSLNPRVSCKVQVDHRVCYADNVG
jgi:hypothetical protein